MVQIGVFFLRRRGLDSGEQTENGGDGEQPARFETLDQVRLETMESRLCPGLHLCGEILDVDGRIGGFNFQWAWASGTVAGRAAAAAPVPARDGAQAAHSRD